MGIYDRDWYRERKRARESPWEAPSRHLRAVRGRLPWRRIALLAAVFAAGLALGLLIDL